MTDAVLAISPLPDPKLILARLNERIALLRAWLSHAHDDEPYWWARRTTAPTCQRERHVLRPFANLLHVERAASRGRLHGRQFESFDEQRAWLDRHAATLTMLREGKLP